MTAKTPAPTRKSDDAALPDIDYRALAAWGINGATGLSSRALAATLSDIPQHDDWGYAYPHDGGDLSRCFGLLNAVPSLKPRLAMAASMGPVWAALIARWGELEALYNAAPVYWNGSKAAKRYKSTVHAIIAAAEKERAS